MNHRQFISKSKKFIKRIYPRLINRRPVISSTLKEYLSDDYIRRGVPLALDFNFNKMKKKTLDYAKGLQCHSSDFEYGFSYSSPQSNIYTSVYACMLFSLFGELKKFSSDRKSKWIKFFDSHQSQEDGLFRDDSISNSIFATEDWWGARHLACHMIIAYTSLGGRPKYDFSFLQPFYDPQFTINWLESRNWGDKIDYTGNEIMNHGVLLQYSRDIFNNSAAGEAITLMIEWLSHRINLTTGLWGSMAPNTPVNRSKMVQAAYHIFPLFFYDRYPVPSKEIIIDTLLSTQNSMGGFGVSLNSSACEDIDTVEPLVRLAHQTDYRQNDIQYALLRFLPWLFVNQNEDGGFVFRRREALIYGHENLSAKPNESNLFATWFRSLCLAYVVNFLHGKNIFHLNNVPGYEFGYDRLVETQHAKVGS
jgi:hypothetical protein